MANPSVELVIKANTKQAEDAVSGFATKANKSLDGLESSFSALKTVALGAVAFLAGSAVFKALDDITKSASESENAINKMEVALKLAGDFSKAASKDFEAFASQLQNSSTFSDEAVLKNVALAKSFNTTNDQAKKLVQAGADLSAALGIGLDEAVQQLGRTLDGTPGRLVEVLPALRNFTAAQFQAGAAIEFVSSRFKGAALADSQTFAGSIAKLKNTFDDLLESLGQFVIKNQVVLTAISALQQFFVALNKSINDNRDTINGFIKGALLGIINGFGVFAQVLKILDEGVTGFINLLLSLVQILGQVPARFKALTTLDFNKLSKLNDDIQESFVNSFSSLTGRENIYDKLTSSIAEFSVQLDKTTSKQIESSRRASDAIENQRKAIEGLSKANREAFIGQIQTNPIAGLFNNSKFGIESPKGATDTDRFAGVLSGIVSQVGKGFQGAVTLFSEGVAAAVDSIIPGLGKAVGPIIEVLAQGPDKVKEFIDQFLNAIPQIVQNIIESLPVIVDALAEKLPDVVTKLIDVIADKGPEIGARLSAQMPFVATRFTIEMVKNSPKIIEGFAKEFLKIPGQFLQELLKQLKGAFDGVGNVFGGSGANAAAGGIGGLIGGAIGGPVGVVGGILGGAFGFASGAEIPAGFPNDTFPARLSSGEIVIPPGPSSQLKEFLDRQNGVGGAGGTDQNINRLITEIRQSSQRKLEINLIVGQKELASVLLDLNRQGFRTA